MKLSVKATAVTSALVWGLLVMFLTGVANLTWPGYGQALLDAMASLYPGYSATGDFGQVLLGTCYGVVDGAIAGGVFAWVYNRFA